MKGDTSSGQETVSTLDSLSLILMFSPKIPFTKNVKLNNDDQLRDNSEWWRMFVAKQAPLVFFFFFKLKETQAFLLGTLSSPLSPKQQRNLEQVCA